ncbi:MAG: ABC transporter ATP-binding protein [Pirellulaceae bacterium]
MLAIETHGLSKSYAGFHSLVDCNLQVPEGVVFGLLGPNGAGKTTLIRVLLGFIRPTAGHATICGFDVERQSLQVRRQVSYLPADARLYRSMRGKDVLELFAGLHHCGDLALSHRVADRLELDTARRVMFMSTGMRQKLAIAIALGCRAPLTVLDEPTANLDPNVRSEVLQLIAEVRQRGQAVVLSSHIFSDIDEACDQVAILRNGRLVVEQDMHALQQTHIVTIQRLPTAPNAQTRAEFTSVNFVSFVESSETQQRLHLVGPPESWLSWLASQSLPVIRIEKAGVRAVYDRTDTGRDFGSASSDSIGDSR